MITERETQQVAKEVETLFGFFGVHGTVDVTAEEESQTIRVGFRAEDPKLFIGEKGQTLFEIQHVLKLMVRRKIESLAPYYISLDINDYKKNKEEYLQDLAQTAADEVSLLKKPKELPAMPAAERRIVHAALTNRTDVVSESIGEEPDRRIVIRIKSETNL